MRIMEFVKRVVVPVAAVMFLVTLFKPICVDNGTCDYLKLWILVGIPFGIHRMFFWLIPHGYDTGGTMAIWVLNFLIGGVIGGVVVTWRLAVAAFFLLKTVIAIIVWMVRKLAGGIPVVR